MREQITKITVLEASKRIGVSRTTIRALIEREEIEKVQEHPVLVSVPSVIRYIAKATTYDEVPGKTKVIYTHLGQIRKIEKYDAYVIVDLKNVLGITNTGAITKFRNEVCHLECEECLEHGLRPLSKGYALIKLADINNYLKICTYNIDKNKLMTELMSQSLTYTLPDAKVEMDEDGVIDIDMTNKQIEIEEVARQSHSEVQVLEQREVLGKQFKIYGTCDNPLFLAKDVAEMIKHTDLSRMMELARNNEKLKRTIYVSGQNREVWFLTEDGLYEVLMRSHKPLAIKFRDQVKEILKTIRKTGGYVAPSRESRFVDHYLSNLPSSTKQAIIESIANKNAELKVLRAQKYEEYRCLDNEVRANETVMKQLEG